jgi:hypothetical protein
MRGGSSREHVGHDGALVPRFAFDWLAESRDQVVDGCRQGDVACSLGMFENQNCLFANGTLAEEDGELVLMILGGISEVRLLPGRRRHLGSPPPARQDGNSVDSTGSGIVREREALRTLAANGWIDATVEGTTLKIRLGEHAKKVREGKEDAKAGG